MPLNCREEAHNGNPPNLLGSRSTLSTLRKNTTGQCIQRYVPPSNGTKRRPRQRNKQQQQNTSVMFVRSGHTSTNAQHAVSTPSLILVLRRVVLRGHYETSTLSGPSVHDLHDVDHLRRDEPREEGRRRHGACKHKQQKGECVEIVPSGRFPSQARGQSRNGCV